MSLFSKIYGTVVSFFQIGGPAGPGWLDNAGNLDARNSSNSSYVNIRAGSPIGLNDVVTKAYGDLNYLGGGSVSTGTAIIDFGVFPGAADATTNITGQITILPTSIVQAWLYPTATTDHSADEHRVEPIEVFADADSIVLGTGFTIYARTSNDRIYGKWNVGWMWH